HADAPVVAGRDRPAARRERGRDLAPARARTDAHEARGVVEHLDRVERAEVDDDAAVVRRPPADAVAARAHRQRHVAGDGLGARERERLDDLGGVAGPQHEPRGPAAQVVRAHARVRGVAGLDRALRERGRDLVVGDAVAARGPDGERNDARRVRPARGALVRDLLAERGDDLLGEPARGALVVGREDERRDALVEHERQQAVDPRRGCAVQVGRPPSPFAPSASSNVPETLSRRVISRGSRPAAVAAASMRALPARRPSRPTRPSEGSHPSAFSPTSRSMRGPSAPSHTGMRRVVPGPGVAPSRRWWRPGTNSSLSPSSPQIARITSIASASASTDSPGARRSTPIETMASQNAPAPSARSTRPPESRSRLAAARASTAGGRIGTLATSGATWMRSVADATYDSSVHVSRKRGWYGWSWNVTRS